MIIDIMVMIKIIENNHREEGHNVILGVENCDKQWFHLLKRYRGQLEGEGGQSLSVHD